ncbi:hypothetical protein [Bellilinea caldifistulae]|uniref:Uncharacterized protein n=1 Tax=Bellilinea caldifistulae TaxID=360411 RepID=A0A0P6XIF9_9CHLR|nr:hypothetical protein [Bellilinea caldifistulae]KPL75270.1 hypothetical protein AC812_10010 [Bellilinea caldifistulae]
MQEAYHERLRQVKPSPPQRLWGRLPRSLALARNDVYKVDLSHPASAAALGEIATLAVGEQGEKLDD